MSLSEDGFSESDIEIAKKLALGRLAADDATVEGAARRLAFYDALDLPGGEDEVRRAMSGVRAEELLALLKNTLHLDRRSSVLIGPKSVQSEEEDTEEKIKAK
jgi:predicted Zn-dependent peptidase